MNIAVLGGGFTGLTSAYYLRKKGYDVTLFEKNTVLGGLASGFRSQNWDWPLEYAYHHLFANDSDILNFARETGFKGIFFRSPETASLFPARYDSTQKSDEDNYRIFPVDTPQDFLRLPMLSVSDKIRAGAVLAFLKVSPFLPLFESVSAETFLKKTMGNQVWKVMWEQLLRKKFGKYAGNILTSFFWARITKRTKNLGYIEGGFQAFIDYLENINLDLGVAIRKGTGIDEIKREGEKFHILGEPFDAVISTLPTPVMTKVTQNVFPSDYLEKFTRLRYLNALVVILETRDPLLNTTYWLNISVEKLPLMFIGQHTNFIDKIHYGGNHLCYIGYYLEKDNPLMKKTKEELVEFLSPHLKTITKKNDLTIINTHLFKAPFAQPIFDKAFVENMPHFETPVKNFFIANLDMTYPYDRGTNYAVKLGKQVATLV